MTDNHSYDEPTLGSTSGWGSQLNSNFRNLDTDVEIRDTDANKGNYTPKDGALYRATDTGAIYKGNGTSWVLADIEVDSLNTDRLSNKDDPATATVYKEGGTIYSVGRDGIIDSGSDFATVVNNTIEQFPNRGRAQTRDGLLKLPEGEFTVSTTIKIYGGTRLRGSGPGYETASIGTVLKADSSLSGPVINYGPFDSKAYFGSIERMRVDGNKSNRSSGPAIKSDNSGLAQPRDLFVNWVWADAAPVEGARFENSHGYTISNSLFENNDGVGLFCNTIGGNTDKEPRIVNVACLLNGGHGFHCLSPDANVSLTSRGNGGAGARVESWGHTMRLVTNDNTGAGVEARCGSSIISVSSNRNGSDGLVTGSPYGTRNTIMMTAEDNAGYGFNAPSRGANVVHISEAEAANTNGLVNDGAVRNLINGWGKNSGDPNSTGDWNGNGFEGAAVVDTANSTRYVYRGGVWV